MMPTWNWDTVNFWSQIAFAFTGLELVSAMSEEVRDPRRTLPRAVFGAGALIALMYIAGTFAILALLPAGDLDPQSGVFQRHHRWLDRAARRLPGHRCGDAGHGRQCGRRRQHRGGHCARAVCRRHRPLSARSLRQNPSAMENAVHFDPGAGDALRRDSARQPDQREDTSAPINCWSDAAIILYFIPFLYMFAAVIKLARRAKTAKRTSPCGAGARAVWPACGSAAAWDSSWS